MTKTRQAGLNNTIISYIGVFLGYLNVAILFPKFFAPEDLGLRSVLMEFSAVLAQFSLFGFTGAVNKFFPFYREKPEAVKRFLAFIFIIPLVGFLLISGLTLAFREQLFLQYEKTSPLIYDFYFLIFPITAFMLYTAILEIYSAFFNPVVATILRDVILRLCSTVLIFLYVFDFISLELFWYLFAGSYGLNLLFIIIYLRLIGQLKLSISFPLIEKEMLKPIFSFTIFGFLLGTASSFILKLDTIMIVYITKDLSAAGIYALALYMASLVEIPKRALGQVTNPLLSTAFRDNDMETIKSLYHKLCLNQLIAGGFIFLLLAVNINEIFGMIPKSEVYSLGKYALLILGASKLIDLSTGNNGEIINYSSYYKKGFIIILIVIAVAVILNLILIPSMGITGAALATMGAFAVFNIIKFVFILLKFKLQPFTGKNLIVVFIAALTYFILQFIPLTNNPIIDIIIKSILVFLLFLLPVLYFKISEDLNKIVTGLLFSKRKNR
ncbi:MAG: lipopolysaccharide biosynthesis protein [Cytophagaceae bacterium]